MRMTENIIEVIEGADRLLVLAKRAGAEEAEVFGGLVRSMDVDLRKDKVEMASEAYHSGLGLRAVINGAVGFSSTNDLSKLEVTAKSAVRAARARVKDEKWRSLPGKDRFSRPKDVFDPRMEEIGSDVCLDRAMSMLDGCMSVPGAEPSSGGVTCIAAVDLIVNSNGVEETEKGTFFHASLDTVARRGESLVTGYEFENSRQLQEGLEEIGRTAAELAKRSLDGQKGETGEFEVILAPLAFSELLEYALVPSICADSVQKGRSSLAGRIGESVAAVGLKIVDDGLLGGGMASSAIDGEGVPSQRTTVIGDGVLKSFLYDSYTAGKDGIRSTGNGMRGGYSAVPHVGTRNLIVSGDTSDVLEDTKQGFLVNGLIGAHTANPVSGDFSVEGKNVFRVEDGEVGRPVRSLMLAGNIFDLLCRVELGEDTRAIGSVVTPSVKVKMKVVG